MVKSMYVTSRLKLLVLHMCIHTIIYVTGFAKIQHNVARTEIHFIA